MLKNIKIGPMPLFYYLPCLAIVLIAVYTGNLNTDIVGTMAFLIVMGWLFNFIGSKIPVFGSWMGGGILLPLFAGSALVFSFNSRYFTRTSFYIYWFRIY